MRTAPLGYVGTEGECTLEQKLYRDIDAMNDDDVEIAWMPPRQQALCRKIVFQIWSHDQGTSSYRAHWGTYENVHSWIEAGVDHVRATNDVEGTELPARMLWIPKDISFYRTPGDSEDIPGENNDSDADSMGVSRSGESQEVLFRIDPDAQLGLQRNVHADRDTYHHTITWYYSDGTADDPRPPMIGDEAEPEGANLQGGGFVRDLRVGDCVTIWAKAQYPNWANTIERAQIDVYWAI
jgi:hypothetical protein